MSDLTRYGVSMAPNRVVNTLLTGWLNAWVVNVKDPNFRLRERSLQLHNTIDEAFAAYLVQLKAELSKLRKMLPEPTRENPFPPMEGLSAVKELEAYLRRVEHVRTLALSAPVLQDDFIFHDHDANSRLLADLYDLDVDLVTSARDMSPDSVDQVEGILTRRQAMIKEFRSLS